MEFFPERLTKIWLLNRLYRYAVTVYPEIAFRRFGSPMPRLERLGSDYGGWYTPAFDLGPESIVYSAGVGQDITFDEALIKRCGCTVHGFDPTPAAMDFIADRRSKETLSPKFIFNGVGLWNEATTLKFFAPKTRGWVGSYSALNLQGTEDSIMVPVKPLSVLMQERGHSHLDLLKIDIEGAEYRVIDEIIRKEIPVRWLCVEFDQPVPFWTTNNMLGRLRESGFRLCSVDRWNFVFCNERLVKTTATG